MAVDLSFKDDLVFDLGDKDLFLMHYGVGKMDGAPGRGSGRYPLGSGENPNQRSGDFLSRIEKLKSQGLSEADIANELGISIKKLRTEMRIANNNRRYYDALAAIELQKQGYTNSAIAEMLGYKGESNIRALISQLESSKPTVGMQTAEMLEEALKSKTVIDVGEGVYAELGVSKGALDEAIARLQEEGYILTEVKLPQASNPTQRTTYTLLVDPSLETGVDEDGNAISLKRYLYTHTDEIQSVADYTYEDSEEGFVPRQYPSSVDSSRIQVVYAEQGGEDRDGLIELRPGVADLDMGGSNYAQVRILVDGTHYLKGMAAYNSDLPDGVDILFNTNKHEGTPMLGEDKHNTVLKMIDLKDPDNPFGAEFTAAGQSRYIGADGNEYLSPINKLKWEGQWDEMSRNLSSQFLAKQPISLINQQLKMTYEAAEAEYESIMKLENPTLRKKLLQDFGDECDGATIHLKAAALPRQSMKVLIPVPDLKDNECYCPSLNNGERVVLVRYPYAGPFESSELIVNNKSRSGESVMKQAGDAIGINSKVASKLSGADFDGDTVVVIPVNDRVRVKTAPSLKGLEGFNPKEEYAYREGMSVMTKALTQKEMGKVSNLITDMTLKGASPTELVRAVKHSMVVIDAEKHHLDYTRSEKEQGIDALKKQYQKRVDPDTGEEKYGGASTLLSRRKQTTEVPERQGSARIDKDTGEYIYKESGRKYYNKKGELVDAKDKVYTTYLTKDAHKLSSGTKQEEAYADYINKMKALGNKARKESANMKGMEYSPAAYKEYTPEVASIKAKLNTAIKNAPKERRAQAIAKSRIDAKVAANPNEFSDKKDLSKLRSQEIREARTKVGATGKGSRIKLTDKEWTAIQKGAIHDSTASKVFRYCDQDELRQRAMPKNTTISTAKQSRIRSMYSQGYTQAEIAKHLGVSTSTVSKYAKG